MRKIGAWLNEAPPVGTGFWCSVTRILIGSLCLLKLAGGSQDSLNSNEMINFVILGIWLAVAFCATVGFYSRVMIFLCSMLCLGEYYSELSWLPKILWFPPMGGGSYGEPTQIYFIGIFLLLLSFTPCGDYFSWDAKVWKRVPERARLWGVQLIRYQICAVYLWAAINKLENAPFRSGHSLEFAWIYAGVGSLGYFHQPQYTAFFMGLGVFTIVFELALCALLFIPRTRPIGIWLGILFHIGTGMVFEVRYFALSMIVSYLMFLDPAKDYGGVRAAEAKGGL